MQVSTNFEVKRRVVLLLGLFLTQLGDVFADRRDLNGPAAASDVERDLTFEIGAGKEECFYELVPQGYVIDIEYQVSEACGWRVG